MKPKSFRKSQKSWYLEAKRQHKTLHDGLFVSFNDYLRTIYWNRVWASDLLPYRKRPSYLRLLEFESPHKNTHAQQPAPRVLHRKMNQ